MPQKIRVRFAPSPTGFMHLGNIRTALFNYLFAKQRNGTFVLRIEDTDQARNVEEASLQIINDLKWLGLSYDEGPIVGGPHAPYLQSERTKIYQQHLDDLIANKKVYRCFCSPERLEKMRKEQISKDEPPRYDRVCLHLSGDAIKEKLAAKTPFIWRFQINQDASVTIKSMARQDLCFEMKNFSDFALTRSDGSFTFLFTNFVDDWLMQISNVIRGEDHLSNTAMQAAIFHALAVPLPTFWHLPMLCNKEGKKLSKRDFGFTLEDLKKEGFLPQAICNYLAIVGGSLKDEIQSLDELAHNFDFDHLHTTGAIRYDVEKLQWVNHKWLARLTAEQVLPHLVPILNEIVHAGTDVDQERLVFLVNKVKNECKTLKELAQVLRFCFEAPVIDVSEIDKQVGKEKTTLIATLIDQTLDKIDQRELFLETIKREGKERGLTPKELFGTLRYLLTGSFKGIGLHDLLEMLEKDDVVRRLGKI